MLWQCTVIAIDKSLHTVCTLIKSYTPALHVLLWHCVFSALDMSATCMCVPCVSHWPCGWLIPYVSDWAWTNQPWQYNNQQKFYDGYYSYTSDLPFHTDKTAMYGCRSAFTYSRLHAIFDKHIIANLWAV